MPSQYDITDIFEKYYNKMYRLAFNICGNKADAEDILQNAFAKIIANIKKFKARSKLSTWIYKITYNETLMYLRHKKNVLNLSNYISRFKKDAPAGLFINWPKMPDKHLLDDELKARLDNAIALMPIQYRMPLLLHNIENISLKETADILGLKLNSLKSRIHRALLLIKSEISDYYKDKQLVKQPKEKLCDIYAGFVYDYASKRLSQKERSIFKKHIRTCQNCNIFLDKYSQAINITHALQCQDIPAGLKDRIESYLPNRKN